MKTDLKQSITVEDLNRTFEAFNRHDIDGVMKCFAEDSVFYTVGGPEVYGNKIVGKQAIAGAFCSVWEAMSDAHWDHHSHFIHNDRAVSEWTFTGTDSEGGRIEAQGADLFTLRDGQIVVKQAFRKDRPVNKA